MRMDDEQESRNVVDERGASGGFRPVHGIGLGTIAIALIAGWVFHINPLQLLGVMSGGDTSAPASVDQGAGAAAPAADDAQAHFVRQILHSTETVWSDIFQKAGMTYEDPKLVLYRDSWPTGCGQGSAAAGPFYCPNDQRVYLDLSFFDLMSQQLQAPGQFAQAYVIAHEVGHHVQDLLGTLGRINAERERSSDTASNALSVRIELQADCLAGVWATRSQQEQGWRLEPGDIESALNAASQIGDDTLERRERGTVVPDSFTHGTSAQRAAWFKRGVDSGSIEGCDTFKASQL
jgi:predicted metalloprotease